MTPGRWDSAGHEEQPVVAGSPPSRPRAHLNGGAGAARRGRGGRGGARRRQWERAGGAGRGGGGASRRTKRERARREEAGGAGHAGPPAGERVRREGDSGASGAPWPAGRGEARRRGHGGCELLAALVGEPAAPAAAHQPALGAHRRRLPTTRRRVPAGGSPQGVCVCGGGGRPCPAWGRAGGRGVLVPPQVVRGWGLSPPGGEGESGGGPSRLGLLGGCLWGACLPCAVCPPHEGQSGTPVLLAWARRSSPPGRVSRKPGLILAW